MPIEYYIVGIAAGFILGCILGLASL